MSCVVVWCVWWDGAFINTVSKVPFKDQADMESVATEPQASINIESAPNSEHKRIEKDETLCTYVLHTTLLPDKKSASTAPLTVKTTNLKDTVPGYKVKVRIVPAFSDDLLKVFSAGSCYDGVVGHGLPKNDGTVDIEVYDNIKSFQALKEATDGELNSKLEHVSKLLDDYTKSYEHLAQNGSHGPLKKEILRMIEEQRDRPAIFRAIEDILQNMTSLEPSDAVDTLFCNTFVHVATLQSIQELLNDAIEYCNAAQSPGNDEHDYRNLSDTEKKQQQGLGKLKTRSEFAKRRRLLAVTSALTAYGRYDEVSQLSNKATRWWVSQASRISQGRAIEAIAFQNVYNDYLRYERFDVWVPDEEAHIRDGVEEWWSTEQQDVDKKMNFHKRRQYGFLRKMRGDSTAWTHNTNELNPPLYKFVVEYLNIWGHMKHVDVLLDGKELHFRVNKTGNQTRQVKSNREYNDPVNVEAVIQAVLLRLKYQLQVGTDEQGIVTKLKPTLQYLKCILDKEHEKEYVIGKLAAMETYDILK